MTTKTIQEALGDIQVNMKAPKTQVNDFGGYSFRSAEDILNAAKPFIKKHECILLLNDELVLMMDRFYVKATAKLMKGEESISVDAFARETENKKGMDEAQITGSASSYARKYALNGLFCIDDVKDADNHDNSDHTPAPKKQQNSTQPPSGSSGSISRDDFPGFGKHKQGGDDPKMWKEVPKHYLEWLSTADKTRDDVKAFVIAELKFRAEDPPAPKVSMADKIAAFETILNGAEKEFSKAELFSTFSSFLMNAFKTTDIPNIAVEFVEHAEAIHQDLLNLLKQEKAALKAGQDD